jgi:ribosome-associated protein
MERAFETQTLKICELLYDKKAEDILALHVSDKTIIADWFVVASGRATVQVKAFADELEEKSQQFGLKLLRKE